MYPKHALIYMKGEQDEKEKPQQIIGGLHNWNHDTDIHCLQ